MDMDGLLKALHDHLRAQGYRLTKPRCAVLETLSAAPAHLTPEQLYQQAQQHYSKLGMVTVYRTLALLERLGLVQRVHAKAGCHSFTLVRSCEGHHHQLICRDCGRVEEFPDCALDNTLEQLHKRTGFAIETHQLEVVGRCPKCQ